jgi:DNA-binding XRE family transcriptional regulator
VTGPRTGGRLAGMLYEPGPPRPYGKGTWPHKRFDTVTDPLLRDACEWWQDLVFEIQTRRRALGLTQQDAAAKAKVALNTYEAIERGSSWGSVPSLLKVLNALELHLEQTVEVRVRRSHRPDTDPGKTMSPKNGRV